MHRPLHFVLAHEFTHALFGTVGQSFSQKYLHVPPVQGEVLITVNAQKLC